MKRGLATVKLFFDVEDVSAFGVSSALLPVARRQKVGGVFLND
ncbi:hypothetical protein DAQ1742_02518 [Dickeya aquatica]|uniref:Uncharacterized protein n=1 Tax=Dickeya aquatica TaxID=1401087 RepID=A0A375ABP6_9GAMM|nr:hypothetical protein DAQ1742_02518 [Dickeya aquatica]